MSLPTELSCHPSVAFLTIALARRGPILKEKEYKSPSLQFCQILRLLLPEGMVDLEQTIHYDSCMGQDDFLVLALGSSHF